MTSYILKNTARIEIIITISEEICTNTWGEVFVLVRIAVFTRIFLAKIGRKIRTFRLELKLADGKYIQCLKL